MTVSTKTWCLSIVGLYVRQGNRSKLGSNMEQFICCDLLIVRLSSTVVFFKMVATISSLQCSLYLRTRVGYIGQNARKK